VKGLERSGTGKVSFIRVRWLTPNVADVENTFP